MIDCPDCGKPMRLDTKTPRLEVWRCKHCGYVLWVTITVNIDALARAIVREAMRMPDKAKRPCPATTSAGKPCTHSRLTDGEFCYQHDPDSATKRSEAAVRSNRTRGCGLPQRRPTKCGLPRRTKPTLRLFCASGHCPEGDALPCVLGGDLRECGDCDVPTGQCPCHGYATPERIEAFEVWRAERAEHKALVKAEKRREPERLKPCAGSLCGALVQDRPGKRYCQPCRETIRQQRKRFRKALARRE